MDNKIWESLKARVEKGGEEVWVVWAHGVAYVAHKCTKTELVLATHALSGLPLKDLLVGRLVDLWRVKFEEKDSPIISITISLQQIVLVEVEP